MVIIGQNGYKNVYTNLLYNYSRFSEVTEKFPKFDCNLLGKYILINDFGYFVSFNNFLISKRIYLLMTYIWIVKKNWNAK